jgi:AraC-like DNA-binding protein
MEGFLGFVCVSEGFAYLQSERQNMEIAQGDVVAAGNMGRITLRASQLQSFKLNYYYLNPNYISFLLNDSELRILNRLIQHTPVWVKVWLASQSDASDLRFLAGSIEIRDNFHMRIRLLQQAALLLGEPFHRESARSTDDPNYRFETVTDALTEAELLSLATGEIAGRCCCSERHFGRMYRKKYGYSLRERVKLIRLGMAKSLLRSSDRKIIDVAFASGFQNLSFFNAAFKRAFGITPSQWREETGKLPGRLKR